VRAEEKRGAEGPFLGWAGSSRCPSSRVCHLRAYANGYNRSHADRNGDANTYPYPYASPNVHSDADTHTDTYSNAHSYI